MPLLELSESAIACAYKSVDSPAQWSALPVDAQRLARAVVDADRSRQADGIGEPDSCAECGRSCGHTPECSRHWARQPTGSVPCPGCKHGNYGPGATHTCGVW